MTDSKTKPKIVIHICCAICGAYLTELFKKDFTPIIFFYNPNIHPREEYEKRKDSAVKLARIYNAEFIEGNYDDKNWFEKIKGFENEPEGGKRCPACFRIRLHETAILAKNKNTPYFTATLAASPYKNEILINSIGNEIAKELNLNFIKLNNLENKQDIWKKTRELAKKYDFYHQKYCGCIFSQTKYL